MNVSPPTNLCLALNPACRSFLRPIPIRSQRVRISRTSFRKVGPQRRKLHFETESSAALGFGFRCGFLGLLHLEIIQERLSREFDLDLVTTAPSVVYEPTMTDGTEILLHNPVDMPDVVKVQEIREPWITATIMTPDEFWGPF